VKDPAKQAELWQRLVKVTKEIKALEPALLSADAPEILTAKPSDGIRVLPKQVGGARYLISVNNTPREVRATFQLAEPAGTIEVVGESRKVSPESATRFVDAFGPYATHVYRMGAAAGS
ncbi:MAG: hypothetical protein ACRELA_11575, partial [Candidatus Rokuibacteriota bacterium]